jgi:hypothetical protein
MPSTTGFPTIQVEGSAQGHAAYRSLPVLEEWQGSVRGAIEQAANEAPVPYPVQSQSSHVRLLDRAKEAEAKGDVPDARVSSSPLDQPGI